MAEKLRFAGTNPMDGRVCFQFNNDDVFSIISFENRTMVIKPVCIFDVGTLVQGVVGCFNPKADLDAIRKIGLESQLEQLRTIEVRVNGVSFQVSAKNANYDKVMKLYREALKEK